MQNINAIIFDFGGVIFDIDFLKLNIAFSKLGVQNFEAMYSQKKASPLFQSLEEGKISPEEFYLQFRKESNSNLTAEEIKTAWNSILVSFRKEALETLRKTRSKYKLYLLSNTNKIHLQAFNKIYNEQVGEGSLEDYFDKVYFSHEIGSRKPGKEPYEIVLRENDLIASETLFIDDSIQNIQPARQLGIQTILLKPGKGIEDLGL